MKNRKTATLLSWKNRIDNATSLIYRKTESFDVLNLPAPIGSVGQGVTEYVDYDVVKWSYNYYRIGTEIDGRLGISEPIIRYGAEPLIISGSDISNQIKVIDPSGTEVINKISDSTIKGVAFDGDGNIYTSTLAGSVVKYNQDGIIIWSFIGHTDEVNNIEVDSNNFVYSCSDDMTVRKIDSNGNEVWSFSGHTNAIRSVAVDADGYVYSGSSDMTVRKIDSNGNEVWSFSGHTNAISSVAVDADGYVYSGSSDMTVRKIDSNGNEVWSVTLVNQVYNIVVDNNGFVYAVSYGKTYKFDSNGTEVWVYSESEQIIPSVSVDADGFIYRGGYDDTIKKLSPDGVVVWTYFDHSGNVRSIDVYPGKFHISQNLLSPINFQ